jgi:hypothetical protein
MADLTAAHVVGTTFGGIDLSETRGLEAVDHSGPSVVGVDTLYASHGKIPELFLRGCGVPDGLIEYLPSLVGSLEPIEFYSCFISHSSTDHEFCKRLYSRMRDEHLRVWLDQEDIKPGRKIRDQIDEQIRRHDKLLLVLSESSMASDWVASEIYRARQREQREGRQLLFPVRLAPFETIIEWECFDSDSGVDIAREIRAYHIPDFSEWKDHDAFEREFAKLLTGLRSETE